MPRLAHVGVHDEREAAVRAGGGRGPEAPHRLVVADAVLLQAAWLLHRFTSYSHISRLWSSDGMLCLRVWDLG